MDKEEPCWFDGNRMQAKAPSERIYIFHCDHIHLHLVLHDINNHFRADKLLVLIFILAMAFIDGQEEINLFCYCQWARGFCIVHMNDRISEQSLIVQLK